MVRLRGTPLKLDTYLRPPIRILQLVLGLGASALLVWLDQWWWVPVPLGLSFLLYEAFFWWRGDRACVVELGERLLAVDRVREQRIEVDPGQVRAATLVRRARSSALDWLTVVLADEAGPVLAMRLEGPTGIGSRPDEVDGGFLDAVLGGMSQAFASLAPPDSFVRQPLHDADGTGLAWLQGHIPTEAWARTGIRVWRGAAPQLTPLAQHVGPPDGWLLLEGDHYTLTLREQSSRGRLRLGRAGRATRRVVLVSLDADPAEQDVDLFLLDLAPELTLALPSPLVATLARPRDLDDELLHCHGAEAVLLVWHLLTHLPRSSWPEPLVRAVDDARVVRPEPAALRATRSGSG